MSGVTGPTAPGPGLALQRVVRALEEKGSRRARNTPPEQGLLFQCPAHNDRSPSLSIKQGKGGVVVYCFGGCETARVLETLGLSWRDLFDGDSPRNRATVQRWPEKPENSGTSAVAPAGTKPSNGATPRPPDLTLQSYAEGKKLDAGFLARLGLRDQPYRGGTALRIPYLDESGEEVAVRYRLHLERDPEADGRFRWRTGAKPSLYGLWRLANIRALGAAILVEGESDAQTLWHHGISALGVPGATSFKREWASQLDGVQTIFAVREPDAAGEAFVRKLAHAGLADRLRVVRLDCAKDVSDLHCQDPDGFQERFSAALDASTVYAEERREQREAELSAAYENCKSLAHTPSILQRFVRDLRSRGVVGEERLAKLTYLAMTSRLLEKPVSIVAKGLSAAGKSYTTRETVQFFPESGFYALTAMSERALVYSEEPLSHRMFIVYESAGLEGEFASYLLRSLLSEGRLRYETVEKTNEGPRARLIERPGPTGVIVTTTKLALHPENETRMLSVPVDDSREQTKAVLRAIAEDVDGADELRQWHALQEWLSGGECRVTVPFARELAERVPPVAVRLRRDFGLLLNLIRAHALLHRASRVVDERGVVATLEDYEVVRELVGDLLGEGVQATVSPQVRETVRAVERLLGEGREEVTVTDLAKTLGLEKGAASRRAHAARRLGHLVNREERKGRPARIALDDPLPEEADLLPTVADLAEALHPPVQRSSARNRSENGQPLHGCIPTEGSRDTPLSEREEPPVHEDGARSSALDPGDVPWVDPYAEPEDVPAAEEERWEV